MNQRHAYELLKAFNQHRNRIWHFDLVTLGFSVLMIFISLDFSYLSFNLYISKVLWPLCLSLVHVFSAVGRNLCEAYTKAGWNFLQAAELTRRSFTMVALSAGWVFLWKPSKTTKIANVFSYVPIMFSENDLRSDTKSKPA